MAEKIFHKLSGGRMMSASKKWVTQMEMFALARKLKPKSECIAKLKEVDEVLNSKKRDGGYDAPIFRQIISGDEHTYGFSIRCEEYAAYNRDPNAPLGSKIVIQDSRGGFYDQKFIAELIVPDIPVIQAGKEISLRKAMGTAIFDSISLLKIKRIERWGKDEMSGRFVVSPVNLDALVGRVRVMNFAHVWAMADEHGFPDANFPKPGNIRQHESDGSRSGWGDRHMDARTREGTTGWHGSISCNEPMLHMSSLDTSRVVMAGLEWSDPSVVAFTKP